MVGDFWIYTDKTLAENSPHKRTAEGEAIITVEETTTAVKEEYFSIDNFVSSFKCISGCQDVDLEVVEK